MYNDIRIGGSPLSTSSASMYSSVFLRADASCTTSSISSSTIVNVIIDKYYYLILLFIYPVNRRNRNPRAQREPQVASLDRRNLREIMLETI